MDLDKLTPAEAIAAATRRGATFEQLDGEWHANAKRRGRPLPLVALVDADQAEAARMFLHYFRNSRSHE